MLSSEQGIKAPPVGSLSARFAEGNMDENDEPKPVEQEAPDAAAVPAESETSSDVNDVSEDAAPFAPQGADAAPSGELLLEGGEEAPVLPPQQVRAILEALIFASAQPLTPREIGQVLQGVSKEDWQSALEDLRTDFARDERGLQIVEVAGGYQITTRPEYNDWVRELLDPKTPTRLSIQALETLAVIAYKQPVTLPEIIDLRGVKSGGVLKTLLEKRLIRITGRKEVVGRPMLYGTTKDFLLHFGLKDLSELPKIEEFAEVLGEEVDVVGLKKAIEAPRPVEVPLTEDQGEMEENGEGSEPSESTPEEGLPADDQGDGDPEPER